MPTINLEMMKQLLQEFSEKEALTTEEIAVIDKEVSDLEKRIEDCRAKLKNLSEDKVRLAAIQQRYSDGKFIPPPNLAISNSTKEASPKPAHRNKPAAIESAKALAGNSKTSSEEEPLNSASKESKEAAHSKELEAELNNIKSKKQSISADGPSNQEHDIKQDEKVDIKLDAEQDTEQDASRKESGDTIKSINDALKGLFRK